MPTDTLLKAIKDRWYGDSGITDLVTGGLFLSQVPDKNSSSRPDLPYAYVDVGKTRYVWTFSQVSGEVADVEFTIFVAGSGVNLETVMERVRARFDWCSLTFQTPYLVPVYFQPLDTDISCEPLKYRDGSLVYRGTLRYESFVNRTLLKYP
jgi:hypothetical protein